MPLQLEDHLGLFVKTREDPPVETELGMKLSEIGQDKKSTVEERD